MDVVFEVPLGPNARGARVARLREPRGFDEQGLEDFGPVAASELLDQLLVHSSAGALTREQLRSLPLSERDRLIALLYRRQFGDRVESTVPCAQCQETCEVSFSLTSLLESVASEATTSERGADEEGFFELPDGTRFRLPTVEDEMAVRFLAGDDGERELLRRCIVNGDGQESSGAVLEAVNVALESIAPLLDVDISATCGMCGTEQSVHFDMVSFFLSSVLRERALLSREIHQLARAYQWSHEEILNIPSRLRRDYVRLIESERVQPGALA